VLLKEDYHVEDIDSIIEKDQALASSVLRVADSPFYAGAKPVKTIQAPMVCLGGDNAIVNLIKQAGSPRCNLGIGLKRYTAR
jgi:HD-like signal output (HDOD) protein